MIAIGYFIAAFERHRSSDVEDHPHLRLRDHGRRNRTVREASHSRHLLARSLEELLRSAIASIFCSGLGYIAVERAPRS